MEPMASCQQTLNIAKTHFLIFHPHQKEINNSLNIETDCEPIN